MCCIGDRPTKDLLIALPKAGETKQYVRVFKGIEASKKAEDLAEILLHDSTSVRLIKNDNSDPGLFVRAVFHEWLSEDVGFQVLQHARVVLTC